MSNTTVLDRFLDPVASFLTPEVAQRLVEFRADAATQSRLDELAEKSSEGGCSLLKNAPNTRVSSRPSIS